MKKTKTKVAPPMSMEDFANDVIDFAEKEASKADIKHLKSEIKDMINTLEAWKEENKKSKKK